MIEHVTASISLHLVDEKQKQKTYVEIVKCEQNTSFLSMFWASAHSQSHDYNECRPQEEDY